MGKMKTHDEFISEMNSKHPTIIILGKYTSSKTPILCKCHICGKEWSSEPRMLSSGKGCSRCSGNERKTQEQFVEEVKRINENVEVIGTYINNSSKISVICKKCGHKWDARAQALTNGNGCPKCAAILIGNKNRKTHAKFMNDFYKIHDDIEVLEQYIDSKTPIMCKCKQCNHEWKIRPNNLLNGQGCPMCTVTSLKTQDKFIEEMKIKHSEIEVLGTYTNSTTRVKCRCKKCENIFNPFPNKILASHTNGCPSCAIKEAAINKTKTHDEFVEDAFKKNQNIKILGKYNGATSKILCECKKCGNKWSPVADKILQGYGCPKCNSSKGERIIEEYLIRNNIKFISQKTFDDLFGVNNGFLSYDFYLPIHNILIEFQGKQHYIPVDYFGGEEQLKVQIEHDNRKRNYAKKYGIQLLEIKYDNLKNIEDVLRKELEVSNERMVS